MLAVKVARPRDDDGNMDSAKPSPSLARSSPSNTSSTGPNLPEPSTLVEDTSGPSFSLREIHRALLETTTEGIYGTDALGITTFINTAATQMTGWAAEDVVGKPHDEFAHHVSPWAGAAISESLLLGPPGGEEGGTVTHGKDGVFLRKNGTVFPAAYAHTSILQHGKLCGTVVVFRDISEEQRKEAWEKSKTEIFSAILRHHPLKSTMQMLVDAFAARCPGKAIAVFLMMGNMFLLEAEAGLPNRSGHWRPRHNAQLPETVDRESVDHESGGRERSAWTVQELGLGPSLEEILASGVKLCMAAPLMSGAGEARGTVTVFDRYGGPMDEATQETLQSVCDLARAAIEHRRLYNDLLYRSHFDRLTGLPNRQLLEEKLRAAMLTARRRGKMIAVCCIDLDHFKQINDALGHELGDEFFKAVNERLNTSVRDLDMLARPDGDEFILALCDLNETSDGENICHRLLRDLKTPFLVEGHTLDISASIGISVFPEHGDTIEGLLHHANLALRLAKRTGPGSIQLYNPALGRQSRRAPEMTDALVSALSQSQFTMAYQPIYSMTKEIVAFEALLRWKHPEWGPIAPLEFIPIAETTGLIVPIGDWVIKEVCRQAKEWDAAAIPPVKMFANISGVQLGRSDFASKIAKALQQSALAPDRLELEITESWVISDLKGAARKLQKLRDLGIGIAIDDFGTGYSMFNYLQELPLDTLKIDRSFIQRLDGSAFNPSTVRAITGLARQLGLKTVAEGVETERHVAELVQIGCDYMQGFLLARPLKPQAAGALLKKQQATRDFLQNTTETDPTKHPATALVAMQK